jgi:hypothetical protein
MEGLFELACLVLYSKLSSCPLAHTSGRAGPTDRSVGLLVGQAHMSGTAETLVGGDPWVPMSVNTRNGTGERLTCGPSLVMNTIRLEKISSRESVKDACGRQWAIVRQRDFLRF